MYIKSLIIRNFRNLRNVQVTDLPPTVVLFGLNGQGKTSLHAALHMLLFGYCEFTDQASGGKTPKQAPDLITDGADEAEISATIETETGGGTATWMLALTLRRKAAAGRPLSEWVCVDAETGEVGAIKSREEWFVAVNVNIAHARIAAMPMAYLHSTDLSSALCEMLSSEIPPERVAEECGEHYDWIQEYARARRLPLRTAQHFADLGTQAFGERREVNRERDDQQAVLEDLKKIQAPRAADGRALGPDDMPAVQAKIDALEETLATLHQELGAAQQATEATADPTAREAAIAAARDAELKSADARTHAMHMQSEHQEATNVRNAAKEAHALAVHNTHQAGECVAAAEKALAALSTESGACPLCHRKYTAKLREELLGPLEDTLAKAKEEYTAAHETDKRALEELDAANKSESEARRTAEDAQAIADKWIQYAARCTTEIPKAVKPYEGRSVEDIFPDVEAVEAKIQRGRETLATLREMKRAEEQAVHVDTLNARWSRLDWAVKAFKDGHVIKRLLRGGLDAFAARCNEELAAYGYRLIAQAEGKRVALLLECGGYEPRPVAQCSNGQQMLAAAAVAMAFANGSAPMLLDNINELDHLGRRQLLFQLRDSWRTSVWLSGAWQTRQSIATVVAPLAPAAVFEVTAGEVRTPKEEARAV